YLDVRAFRNKVATTLTLQSVLNYAAAHLEPVHAMSSDETQSMIAGEVLSLLSGDYALSAQYRYMAFLRGLVALNATEYNDLVKQVRALSTPSSDSQEQINVLIQNFTEKLNPASSQKPAEAEVAAVVDTNIATLIAKALAISQVALVSQGNPRNVTSDF